jgi:exosortase
MASVVATPSTDSREPGWKRVGGRLDLLAAIAIWGLAHAVWLTSQANVLWRQPHYQFFPLLLVGVLALAAKRFHGLGQLAPGRPWITYSLLVADGALMILADRMRSPMVATVASWIAVLAVAQGLGGGRLVRAVLPAWLLLWVLIRPPLGLDTELIFRLQTLATRWSGAVLDGLGIDHVTSGHVIEIVDRRLMIEEACSGIQSLFVVLAGTLFYAFWGRVHWLRTLFLLIVATVWVLLGNVARIVAVAAAAARLRIDLGTGWRHETLGFVILVLVLALVASTDRMLQFVLDVLSWMRWRIKRRWEKRKRRSGGSRRKSDSITTAAITADSGTTATGIEPAPGSGVDVRTAPTPTALPAWQRTFLGSRKVVYGLGLLGILVLVLNGSGFSYAAPTIERRFSRLNAEAMPAQSGAYRRESFDESRQGPRYGRGEFFRNWQYQSPDARLQVAVSYPFIGWHELTECYQAEGWLIEDRRIDSEPGANAVVAQMSKPLEKSAVLWFGFDDGTGAPMAPSTRGGWRANLRERLSLGWWRSALFGRRLDDTKTSYQVQVLVQSDHSLTPAELAEARTLFERARENLRRIVRGEDAS